MDWLTEWVVNIDWIDHSLKLLGAVAIFIFGRWVSKRLVNGLGRVMKARNLDDLLIQFVSNILSVLLLVMVILIAINYLGIPITPLLAILGGAALAVGLALQSSLSNFASGIMLVAFRPFTKGDFVDAGGVAGTVQSVGIFHTELKTPDNRHIVVGNSSITSSNITNFSAYDTRRIDLVIGVHYDDDLKLARSVIEKVLREHPNVLDDPEPTIMLMDLGESSVDFAVRPWVKSTEFWPTRGQLLEQLKAELEAAGCSIPFPQRDVHHYNHPAAAEKSD